MKNTYSVRSDVIKDDQDNPHIVYGINIVGAQPIPNIFTSKTEAARFSSLCNRLHLSPIHIHEVIDDLL